MVPNVVTFDPQADLILVPVEVRGPLGSQGFTFALDTGCAETLVTPEVVDTLGYSPRDGTALKQQTAGRPG